MNRFCFQLLKKETLSIHFFSYCYVICVSYPNKNTIQMKYVHILTKDAKVVHSNFEYVHCISSIFDKCSILLLQMQSRPKHTSYRNFHFNELVANALHDNIGSKKPASNLRKKMRRFLISNIKNLSPVFL